MSHEGRYLRKAVAKEKNVEINVVTKRRVCNNLRRKGSFETFSAGVSTVNHFKEQRGYTFSQIPLSKNIIPRPS
jgi:hypothetical protein